MTTTSMNRHKKSSAPYSFGFTPLSRDEFVDHLLPWLIGVPISLIVIRVLSF